MNLRTSLVVLAFIAWLGWGYYSWVDYGVENAPRTSEASGKCKVQAEDAAPLRIPVSVSKYPENWRHIVDARAGRNTGPDGETVIDNGLKWPRVLVLNRRGADGRRDAAFRLSGLSTKSGKARDEYPPAFGRKTNSADVRYVDARKNSGQGASMGNRLRGRCDGTTFVLVRAR